MHQRQEGAVGRVRNKRRIVYARSLQQRTDLPSGSRGHAASGIYFWHDYPKSDRTTLDPNWSEATPRVNEKYAFVWKRFLDELSEAGEKLFVILTTQENIVEFASDEQDFRDRFALDAQFIDELATTLSKVCFDRFSILALVRSSEEADAIRAYASFERVTVRFCGPLPLKAHQPIVDILRAEAAAL